MGIDIHKSTNDVIRDKIIKLEDYHNVISYTIQKYRESISELEKRVNSSSQRSLIDPILISFNSLQEKLKEEITSTNKFIEFWRYASNSFGGIQFQQFSSYLKDNKSKMQDWMRKLGLNFFKQSMNMVVNKNQINQSITNDNWIQISLSLKNSSNFNKVAKSLEKFYKEMIQKEVDQEISKARMKYRSLPNSVFDHYREKYLVKRLSFDTFYASLPAEVKTTENIDNKQKNLGNEIRNPTEATFDDYESYLKADERELARMKRTGAYGIDGKKIDKRVRKPKSE